MSNSTTLLNQNTLIRGIKWRLIFILLGKGKLAGNLCSWWVKKKKHQSPTAQGGKEQGKKKERNSVPRSNKPWRPPKYAWSKYQSQVWGFMRQKQKRKAKDIVERRCQEIKEDCVKRRWWGASRREDKREEKKGEKRKQEKGRERGGKWSMREPWWWGPVYSQFSLLFTFFSSCLCVVLPPASPISANIPCWNFVQAKLKA